MSGAPRSRARWPEREPGAAGHLGPHHPRTNRASAPGGALGAVRPMLASQPGSIPGCSGGDSRLVPSPRLLRGEGTIARPGYSYDEAMIYSADLEQHVEEARLANQQAAA